MVGSFVLWVKAEVFKVIPWMRQDSKRRSLTICDSMINAIKLITQHRGTDNRYQSP